MLLVHNKSAYTLTETKAGSYGLIVSLDDDGKAKGDAVVDDGLTNDCAYFAIITIPDPSREVKLMI